MTTIEETEIELIIVFLETLLEKMPVPETLDWRKKSLDPATLDYANLQWTIKVVRDRFLPKRRAGGAK